MRTIIAGGREYADIQIVLDALCACPWSDQIEEIITGGAKGIDTLADQVAKENQIDRIIAPANWGKYGKSAGYKRNFRMSFLADSLIAIPGAGPGTRQMIKIAQEQGLKVFIYEP